MNCQDISRIADTGGFDKLTEAERREAETHARTCRSCAAVWATHARLAALHIPSMPAELALRCRPPVVASAQSHSATRPRRLTFIGVLVAIAAAAGLLLMHLQSAHAPGPESGESPAATPLVDSVPTAVPVAVPAAEDSAAAASPDKDASVASHTAIPLLPMPAAPDRSSIENLALQKLVERHPELVEGPELEGNPYFMAAMTMRPDGDVISSVVRPRTNDTNLYELDHEVWRTTPTDAGTTLIASPKRHSLVPDGRALRGDLNFRIILVPASYNAAHSTSRVRELLAHRYDHLLLPSTGGATGGVLNRLTILFAADGSILQENVEPERQELSYTNARADDPKDVARYAEGIATRLGVDVKQIGLMGTTDIEEGSIKLVDNGTPGGFLDDKTRKLLVRYAWTRGSEESSPTLRQEGVTKPPVDPAAALAIVEQQIPEAFTARNVGAEAFMVVLTANGQLLKAGRIQMQGSVEMMARQLVAGVNVASSSFTTARLTNKAGATADVRFVWEVPEAGAAKPAN